jgi:hypothetical protein
MLTIICLSKPTINDWLNGESRMETDRVKKEKYHG